MDSLSIYLVSYNVACKPPEENLGELLGLDEPEKKLPDLYVVGLQEVKAQVYNILLDSILDDPWTIAFKMKLKSKDYVKLKPVRLQGLILSIYAKRKHLLNIRDIEVQYTRTGFGGFWGNKGGVAIRMNIYGVSVCVVNTHLTPHDQNLQGRIQDYNTIISETNFSQQKETSLIFYHDYVFWIGDNNFRIDEAIAHEEILEKIKANKLDWLKNLDQLKCIMRNGQAFSELIEEPFHFPPTYKYIFKSSKYDPKRRPAWTDRILYRVNANAYENITLSAKMKFYKSFPNYLVSDHKPVAGEFTFKVFSDYCDHIIEFSPIKKWYINEENSVTFTAEHIQISDWDWIGIYKYDFCALDEYVSFVYVNTVIPSSHDLVSSPSLLDESSSASTPTVKIIFPDGMVRTKGKYCLLYLTADYRCVLGISQIFEADFRSALREDDSRDWAYKFSSFLKLLWSSRCPVVCAFICDSRWLGGQFLSPEIEPGIIVVITTHSSLRSEPFSNLSACIDRKLKLLFGSSYLAYLSSFYQARRITVRRQVLLIITDPEYTIPLLGGHPSSLTVSLSRETNNRYRFVIASVIVSSLYQ